MGSLQPGTPIDIKAQVTNDPSNAGVDWIVTCQATNNCGSLSSLHTDSDKPTTYTPPSTLSKNTETINIVAYATADHTQNVDAAITVTGFGSNFNGTYILQAQGIDANASTYQIAAAMVLDGNGGITSGEQTVNFTDPTSFRFCQNQPISLVEPTSSVRTAGERSRSTPIIRMLARAEVKLFAWSSCLLPRR